MPNQIQVSTGGDKLLWALTRDGGIAVFDDLMAPENGSWRSLASICAQEPTRELRWKRFTAGASSHQVRYVHRCLIWFFRWRNSSFLTQMFPIYQASGWNAEKGVTLANGQFIPDEVPSPWAAQCSALLSRRDAAVRYSFNTKVYSSYIDDISVGRQGLCAHFFHFTNAADQRKFKVHVPLKIPTSEC